MILSIVILHYNTLDLILECLDSLQKKFREELENKELEIIAVDNASKKEIQEKLEEKVKNLIGTHLIKSIENLGFGRGNNLGAKNSSGEYVLFLNSDTKVLDRGFLEMVNFMKKNPDVGILGAKLLNSDGTAQESAGKFYNLGNFFIMLFGLERVGLLKSSPEKVSKVDWVAGACLMVKKEIFDKLDGFSKEIFMYVEDMDLSYRAKMKGYETYFYPNASVIHKEQGSSNRSFAVVNIYKGLLYFYRKHKSNLEYFVVRFSLFSKALIVYLLGKITNNSYYTNTYGEALKLFKD